MSAPDMAAASRLISETEAEGWVSIAVSACLSTVSAACTRKSDVI